MLAICFLAKDFLFDRLCNAPGASKRDVKLATPYAQRAQATSNPFSDFRSTQPVVTPAWDLGDD